MITPQLELQILSGNATMQHVSHAYGTTNFINCPENKSIIITSFDVFRSLNAIESTIAGRVNTLLQDSQEFCALLSREILLNGLQFQVEIYSKEKQDTFTFNIDLQVLTSGAPNQINYLPIIKTIHKDCYSVHKSSVYIRLKLTLNTELSLQWVRDNSNTTNPANDLIRKVDTKNIYSSYTTPIQAPGENKQWYTNDLFIGSFTACGNTYAYSPYNGYEFNGNPAETYSNFWRFPVSGPNPQLIDDQTNGWNTTGVKIDSSNEGNIVATKNNMIDAFFPYINIDYVLLNYAVGGNGVIPLDKIIK
jgi:hypothetical protein